MFVYHSIYRSNYLYLSLSLNSSWVPSNPHFLFTRWLTSALIKPVAPVSTHQYQAATCSNASPFTTIPPASPKSQHVNLQHHALSLYSAAFTPFQIPSFLLSRTHTLPSYLNECERLPSVPRLCNSQINSQSLSIFCYSFAWYLLFLYPGTVGFIILFSP